MCRVERRSGVPSFTLGNLHGTKQDTKHNHHNSIRYKAISPPTTRSSNKIDSNSSSNFNITIINNSHSTNQKSTTHNNNNNDDDRRKTTTTTTTTTSSCQKVPKILDKKNRSSSNHIHPHTSSQEKENVPQATDSLRISSSSSGRRCRCKW